MTAIDEDGVRPTAGNDGNRRRAVNSAALPDGLAGLAAAFIGHVLGPTCNGYYAKFPLAVDSMDNTAVNR